MDGCDFWSGVCPCCGQRCFSRQTFTGANSQTFQPGFTMTVISNTDWNGIGESDVARQSTSGIPRGYVPHQP
eukprot:4465228-Pyramimonas_sp.AAC.1